MTSEFPVYEFLDAVRFAAAWTALDPELVESVLEAKARYLELAGIAVVEEDHQLLAERSRYAHCMPVTPMVIDDGEGVYLEEVTGLGRDILERIAQADAAYLDSLGLIEWEDDDERDRALGAPALPDEGASRLEGHGHHWECVVPSAQAFVEAHHDTKLGADTLLRCVPSPDPQWEAVVVHGLREGPGLATVRIDGLRGSPEQPERELVTLFPAIWEAPAQPLRLERAHPWRNRCEAIVEAATPSGAGLAFFDIDFLNPLREWDPGEVLDVQLAAFAYRLEPAPDDIGRIPDEERNPDDFSIQGTVTEVEILSAWGETLYRLNVAVLIDTTGGEDRPLHLPILVAARNLADGYRPRPGHRVRGTLWMQGRIGASGASRPGPDHPRSTGAGLGGPAIIQDPM